MEKRPKSAVTLNNSKTSPILLRAHTLMNSYSRVTGACICIHDQNCMPIPELSEEMLNEKNICLFCIKYRKHTDGKNFQHLNENPCREIHINAIKKSYCTGGSCIYVCALGFIFWTSPICLDKQFSGALMGSGFLMPGSDKTYNQMYDMCKETVSETELRRLLSRFPRGDDRKIKSMAELMLICAQSLSAGSKGYHTTIKRRAEQQEDISAKIEDLKGRFHPDSNPPAYPLDKERKLLEVLKKGNSELGKQLLNEILAILFFAHPDRFKYIQYRAIELAILLFRIDTASGFAAGTVFETNNRYLKSIQNAANIEELADALHQIADDIAEGILSFRGIRHVSALKKAEYYILENLTRKISLGEIAKASGFSPPYFSTIFKEEMGENFSGYLNRLRVEKAGYMLTETNLSLSKIAHTCGFEDQSWFSKIFKQYTGMSPGKYRSQGGKPASKIPPVRFAEATGEAT